MPLLVRKRWRRFPSVVARSRAARFHAALVSPVVAALLVVALEGPPVAPRGLAAAASPRQVGTRFTDDATSAARGPRQPSASARRDRPDRATSRAPIGVSDPKNPDPIGSVDLSYELDMEQAAVLDVDASRGVLANEVDLDGNNFTAQLVRPPAHAWEFSLDPDGSFRYRPYPVFRGKVEFEYAVTDGWISRRAKASIHVRAEPVVVSLAAWPPSFTEGDAFTIEAVLDRPAPLTFVVNLEHTLIENHTGLLTDNPLRFTHPTGAPWPAQIVVGRGARTGRASVRLVDDEVARHTQLLKLRVLDDPNTGEPRYVVGERRSAAANVLDNEKPEVSLLVTRAAAKERKANSTPMSGEFKVIRKGDLNKPLDVIVDTPHRGPKIAPPGIATSNLDFVYVGVRELQFASGQDEITRTVDVLNDTMVEGAEVVELALAPSDNFNLGACHRGTITIVDNDFWQWDRAKGKVNKSSTCVQAPRVSNRVGDFEDRFELTAALAGNFCGEQDPVYKLKATLEGIYLEKTLLGATVHRVHAAPARLEETFQFDKVSGEISLRGPCIPQTAEKHPMRLSHMITTRSIVEGFHENPTANTLVISHGYSHAVGNTVTTTAATGGGRSGATPLGVGGQTWWTVVIRTVKMEVD